MFSQIKYIQHVQLNFCSVAEIMSKGWTCGGSAGGAQGVGGGNLFFEHGHVAYQFEGDDE